MTTRSELIMPLQNVLECRVMRFNKVLQHALTMLKWMVGNYFILLGEWLILSGSMDHSIVAFDTSSPELKPKWQYNEHQETISSICVDSYSEKVEFVVIFSF